MWQENYHFEFYNVQDHLLKTGDRNIFDVESIYNFAMQKKNMVK